jgi:uncharacterized SAM-binding protein YcdF (DUF218 family)
VKSLVLRALAAIGGLMLIVTATPLVTWWTSLLARPWSEAPSSAEVLIVLSADCVEPSMIGRQSYWRSVYAVWTWRQSRFQQVWISGNAECTAAMRDFMVSQGVPATAIRLEQRSHSTRENALHTAELLRSAPGRKVLLTSDFHLYRASRAFRAAGMPVDYTVGVPDAGKRSQQWTLRWEVFLDLVRETGKTGWYTLRGW